MKNQLGLVKRIVELSEQNPSAKIEFLVGNDFVSDFGWTNHRILRVELRCWIVINERIYTDEDSAKDEIGETLYADYSELLNDVEYEAVINRFFDENSENAICVFTSAR